MKITKVCCQGCGADLEVDGSVRFVTCNYCHSRLEVVHDASVTHTRLMETMEENTGRIVGNLKVIELQNDLDRLDREWAARRESFMVTGQNGHRSLPSAGGGLIGGLIAIVFGIFWLTMTSKIGAPSFFPLFGLVFIAFAFFGMFRQGSKAAAYQNAEAEYQGRRNSLIRGIEQARDNSAKPRQPHAQLPK